MSHRRGSKLQSAVLSLSLEQHQSTQHSHAAVLRTLIKHLLFFRGQVPSLYEQLSQQTERPNPGHRRRPSKGVRRTQQFLAAAEDLFGSVQEGLFALDGPTRCLVLLGASAARPREAYEVCFPAPDGGGGGGQGGGGGDAGPLCRFVLRQLVVATPDIPEGTADQSECSDSAEQWGRQRLGQSRAHATPACLHPSRCRRGAEALHPGQGALWRSARGLCGQALCAADAKGRPRSLPPHPWRVCPGAGAGGVRGAGSGSGAGSDVGSGVGSGRAAAVQQRAARCECNTASRPWSGSRRGWCSSSGGGGGGRGRRRLVAVRGGAKGPEDKGQRAGRPVDYTTYL